MFRTISILCVIIGMCIMSFSIFKFILLLNKYKEQSYTSDNVNSKIHNGLLAMMITFLFGYIFFVVILQTVIEFNIFYVFISLIFIIGSIFVLTMVVAQTNMFEQFIIKSTDVVSILVKAIDTKDKYAKGHSQHVYEITKIFYSHLPLRYRKIINETKLLDAALLHDIGKISIPDEILNKTEHLSQEEWKLIYTHPSSGKDIIDKTSYKEIGDWILYHHERIDGGGYNKLNGNQIPIEAKIIAISDTFSALYTDRIYRKAFTYSKAISILKQAAENQLDSELVSIFCTISQDEFDKITLN